MADSEQLRKLRSGAGAWNRWRYCNPQIRPDLERANLANMDLIDYNLSLCNLRRAALQSARIYRSSFCVTDLTGANLEGVRAQYGNFGGACLAHARMNGCHLEDTNLACANLREVRFQRAELFLANLYRTNFERTVFGDTLANIGILVGNTDYQNLGPLACCREDVLAVQQLLEATKKFDNIQVILNEDSFQLKERIRGAIDAQPNVQEIFFYFTGHGYQRESDFFFCSTNFDSKRPNETGLSNSELHTLLRAPEANLVVKVIDACSSGTLLVKSDGAFLPVSKQGFKNIIQMASCLDSQNSLTGEPLSLFTEKFRTAALRKSAGAVYYTDIIDALRDEFLDNNDQTPHFVSQGTGREQFVDDASRLDALRTQPIDEPDVNQNTTANVSIVISSPRSSLEILERAERQFANLATAQQFISVLFDKLTQRISEGSMTSDLFSSEIVVHSDFQEPTTRSFLARVLSGEKRPDNFVTALVIRPRDPLLGIAASWFNQEPAKYELTLNCSLDKAQLKITLTPKFVTLKQLVLVVTCAPSLQVCYVFEMLTQHSLRDWSIYDPEGEELVRRWYKKNWNDDCDSLVDGICEKIDEAVRKSIDGAVEVLQG